MPGFDQIFTTVEEKDLTIDYLQVRSSDLNIGTYIVPIH